MKLFCKVVDERQELELMRIERNTFWVMYLALVIALFVQLFALGFDLKHVAGEFIVIVTGVAYAATGYIRHGLWDYFSKPGMKTYILYSLVMGILLGVVVPLTRYFRHNVPLSDCLIIFAISFMSIFILTFLMSLLLGTIIKKRQEKLQQEYKEDK